MQVSDRRFARRFSIAKRVHFSLWNSHAPEQVVESVNISERGTYFETDLPPDVGATLRLQIEMPEEVTGVPAAGISGRGARGKIAKGSSRSKGQGRCQERNRLWNSVPDAGRSIGPSACSRLAARRASCQWR